MSKFTIYSKDGSQIRFSGNPKYSGTYLNVAYLEFSNIESPFPINWEVGDYIDYHRTGLRYKLYAIPEPKKQARQGAYGAAFVYSGVKFYESTKELEIALFRDLVPDDNEIHFSTRADVSTYENVYGIAARIQKCMDDIFPNKWRIEVYNTNDSDLLNLFNETKEYSVNNGSCLDALSQIYDIWKNVGWVYTYDAVNDKDVITIGKTSIRTEDNTTDAFVYGINNGLTSIKKAAANEAEFATRLYVYGSERNIQTRHYNAKNILDKDSVNIVNLMIPVDKWGKTGGLPDARKAYLQADDAVIAKYGLIPRIVYFDGNEQEEIYPSIKGLTMAEVRKAMIAAGESSSEFLPADKDIRIDEIGMADYSQFDDGAKEDHEAKPAFVLGLRNVGFDIAVQGKLTDEGYATISMKSGMCAGREFKVRKRLGPIYPGGASGDYTYELERAWDDSLGMSFPNKIYYINAGDEFVLLDIPMPEYYITLAEERLYKAGENLLADYTRVSAFYEPSINPIKIKEGGKLLRQGMYMKVYDEDVIDTKDHIDYVLIDTLSIDESATIPTYKVTLREQKRAARTFSALEEMIEDAKHSNKQEIARQKSYTERRFRSAQETIELLRSALDHYSEGINPITVETMSVLLGDKSLQFRFTESKSSLDPIPCPISYNKATKQLMWDASALIHLTLGIETITTSTARNASDYKSWYIPADNGEVLDDSAARYIYAQVPEGEGTGTFVASKEKIALDQESGYYHFLVGILNSEYEGSRDFVTLYGFTEILPGQISTDVIRSADGNTYFDLANGKIVGAIEFGAGSKGIQNVEGFSEFLEGALGGIEVGGQNIIRNSGFTGDYLSEQLADDSVLDATSQMFNPPLVHWDAVDATVQDSSMSVSGKEVVLSDSGSISQKLYQNIIVGEHYVLSLRAKGEAFTYNIGGVSDEVNLSSEWDKLTFEIIPTSTDNVFSISNATCTICDLQLERGTIASAWGTCPLDNNSDRAYYEALKHLDNILKPVTEATTTVAGGLVLTNAIHVGNYVDQVLRKATGGMSGTWTKDDDPFLWGGGTMSEANKAIESNGEEGANFVLTHGGKAILNEAIIRGVIKATGGNIGGLQIVDGGLKVVDEYGNDLLMLSPNASLINSKAQYYGTMLKRPIFSGSDDAMDANSAFRVSLGDVVSDSDVMPVQTLLNLDGGTFFNGKLGLGIPHGMVGGMRPSMKAHSQGTLNLSPIDHTVLLTNSTTVNLPANPQDGQEYELICPNTSAAPVTVQSASSNMYLMFDGNVRNGFSVGDLGGTRQVVKMVYSAEDGKWFVWHHTY